MTRRRFAVSSIEGYGAPIIDIMHGGSTRPLTSAVVGAMLNLTSSRNRHHPRHR